MLFLLSKVIQLVGMGTVGFGLIQGISRGGDEAMMIELKLLLAGTAIFGAGWMLQKRGEA